MLARLSLLALVFAPAFAVAQAPAALRVPAYTQLVLRMKQPVSSDRARVGSTFRFAVVDDVVIAGRVVIPAGSDGEGEVIHADESGGRDHPGELVLAARYVEVDGQKIRLRSFVAGATNHANDALAVPVADHLDPGGGRGDPASLGLNGMASARTAEDVLLPPQAAEEPAAPRVDSPPPDTHVEFTASTGTVVFFRELGKSRGGNPAAHLRDGARDLADLGMGRYLTFSLPTGIHEFRSRAMNQPDIRLEIDGGETYYVSCGQPKSAKRTYCAPSNQSQFEFVQAGLRPAN